MDLGFKALALTALLSSSLILGPATFAQSQQPTPADPQAVPDAPAPQAPSSLKGLGPLTPGIGSPSTAAASSSTSTDVPQQAPATQPPPAQTKDVQTTAPESMTPEDIGSHELR